MKVSIETVVTIITGLGVIGGIISWWLSKILGSIRDNIAQGLEIEHLKNEVAEMRQDIKNLEAKVK